MKGPVVLASILSMVSMFVWQQPIAYAGATGLACNSLTPAPLDQSTRPNWYRFTVDANPGSAHITGYRFSFSDGSGQATTPFDHPFIDKKVYTDTLTVQAVVLADLVSTPLSESCSATVNKLTPGSGGAGQTTTPAPAPTETAAPMPDTGAGNTAGGAMGIAGLVIAMGVYLRSRRLGVLSNR